jgi:ribonuclease BN (tRNA processing enzyme)
MEVTFLGVGEAFDPDEANASVLVQAGGFTLLIDCGHSAVSSLWRRCPEPDEIDAVYLTHHHGDHVLGRLPVLDRCASGGRRHPFDLHHRTGDRPVGQPVHRRPHPVGRT